MRRDISDLLRYHPALIAIAPVIYLPLAVSLFALCWWAHILAMSGVPLQEDIEAGSLIAGLQIGKPCLSVMAGLAYGTVVSLLSVRSLRAAASSTAELNRHVAWLLLPPAHRKKPRRKLWGDRRWLMAYVLLATLALVATAVVLRFSIMIACCSSWVALIVAVPARRMQYRRVIARLTDPDVVGLDASRHWTAVQKKTRRVLLAAWVVLLCALVALAFWFGPWVLDVRRDMIVVLAEEGGELPADTVANLEERLERRPDNPCARAQLIGHYWCNAEVSEQARQSLNRHASWVIRNDPDGILGRWLSSIRSSGESGQVENTETNSRGLCRP